MYTKRLLMLMLMAGLIAWNPLAVDAHHSDGHDKGGGNGNKEEPTTPETIEIDLIPCADDAIATWDTTITNDVTFYIDNVSGVGDDVIQAVRDGVVRWNAVPGPYVLVEDFTGSADITISLFFKIIPGSILGFAGVNCSTGAAGIQSAAISLGVKGLKPTGVTNVTAHEVGHALGLGHTDAFAEDLGDLMGARFEKKEEGRRDVCPSTLDTGGLTAATNPFAIPTATWAEHTC